MSLKELFKGLNTTEKTDTYIVMKVNRGEANEILHEGLTRDQAQEIVLRDMEVNPKAEKYMLTCNKSNKGE